MELESFGFSKERAQEMVNILCRMRRLIKNPRAKVDNSILLSTVLLIVLTAVFGCLVFLGIMSRSVLIYVCAGFYLALIILYVKRVVIMHKTVKMMMDLSSSDRKVTLEKDGAVLKVSGVSDTKFYWSSFTLMRVFSHNIVFIPKDMNSQSLSLPIQDLDAVKQFMRENGVEMEMMEG